MSRRDPRRPVILLADDDADDRQLAQEALAEAKVAEELRCVENGEALLDYLRRRGAYANAADAPAPSIILLDLNMPLKDGREALADIRADPALRAIPVVVFTTSKAREDIDESYRLGASSFITKPPAFNGLVETMRDLARYWFERVELPSPATP